MEKNRLLNGLTRIYNPIVRFALRRRWVLVTAASLLLVLTLLIALRTGREFLPYLDEGTLVVQLEKLPSISLEKSMEIDDAIGKELMKLPEIAGLASRVGSDELRWRACSGERVRSKAPSSDSLWSTNVILSSFVVILLLCFALPLPCFLLFGVVVVVTFCQRQLG